jgi:hypothetical protein
MNELHFFREHFVEAISEDGVGMPTTDFHDPDGPYATDGYPLDQTLNFLEKDLGFVRITKFINEFHRLSFFVADAPR